MQTPRTSRSRIFEERDVQVLLPQDLQTENFILLTKGVFLRKEWVYYGMRSWLLG